MLQEVVPQLPVCDPHEEAICSWEAILAELRRYTHVSMQPDGKIPVNLVLELGSHLYGDPSPLYPVVTEILGRAVRPRGGAVAHAHPPAPPRVVLPEGFESDLRSHAFWLQPAWREHLDLMLDYLLDNSAVFHATDELLSDWHIFLGALEV